MTPELWSRVRRSFGVASNNGLSGRLFSLVAGTRCTETPPSSSPAMSRGGPAVENVPGQRIGETGRSDTRYPFSRHVDVVLCCCTSIAAVSNRQAHCYIRCVSSEQYVPITWNSQVGGFHVSRHRVLLVLESGGSFLLLTLNRCCGSIINSSVDKCVFSLRQGAAVAFPTVVRAQCCCSFKSSTYSVTGRRKSRRPENTQVLSQQKTKQAVYVLHP